ncbi:hypothetical protein [Paraurantiacibacter namhicola]|uniref:hypothetical protein n=1 Tax=Paraurantiacibacter namhicola TaxID=645517 RepID=UPI00082A58A3|nr:hypothetical protein [Paraurantiacibacter namhicola]
MRVWLMVFALVLAAFLGAALGLVWQRWIADDSPQEVGSDGTEQDASANAAATPVATPNAR